MVRTDPFLSSCPQTDQPTPGLTSSATRQPRLRLALGMPRPSTAGANLGRGSPVGPPQGSKQLEDGSSAMEVNDGPKVPGSLPHHHTEMHTGNTPHRGPARLCAGFSAAFVTTQGCSGWLDTSWHSQASPCQPPAWAPSPPPWQTPSCCPCSAFQHTAQVAPASF